MRMPWLGLLLAFGLQSATVQGNTWLLVVSGVGGDAEHRASFVDLSLAMIDAALERYGMPEDRIVYLAERVDLAPGRVDGRSTRAELDGAIGRIAASAAAGDQVMILLIGHGSAQGREARFALPGPDVGPADLAIMLAALGDQRVALVNTAAASGGFVAELSAPNRAVITATRGPQQLEETLFPRFFVEAFVSGGADLDKDERVSVLEAFRYATAEVQRAYESDGRLRTEHALLDDNGDGTGSQDPDPQEGDGSLARLLALGRPLATAAGTPSIDGTSDPELRALLARRAELQAAVDALRLLKDEMQEDLYFDELEKLLVEIAELDAAVRARGDSRP